jgi:hypothetical protein
MIVGSETEDRPPEISAQRFATGYGTKYPEAVTMLEKDTDTLPVRLMRRPGRAT